MTTSPQLKVQDALNELVRFVRAHGAPCFVNWPESVLRDYLFFHAGQGTLVLIRRGSAITGIGIGWQCFEHEIEQHWLPTHRDGDTFYFAHLIASEPAAVAGVVAEFRKRWPEWRALKLFARRHNRVVRYTHALLEQLEQFGRRGAERPTGAGSDPTPLSRRPTFSPTPP